jgi:hypothetical protein
MYVNTHTLGVEQVWLTWERNWLFLVLKRILRKLWLSFQNIFEWTEPIMMEISYFVCYCIVNDNRSRTSLVVPHKSSIGSTAWNTLCLCSTFVCLHAEFTKFLIGMKAISNLHVSYSSLNAIVMMRTRNMCWEGKAACMGEMKHVWNFISKSSWKI